MFRTFLVALLCGVGDVALTGGEILLGWMQDTAAAMPDTPAQPPDYYKEAGWDDSARLAPMAMATEAIKSCESKYAWAWERIADIPT